MACPTTTSAVSSRATCNGTVTFHARGGSPPGRGKTCRSWRRASDGSSTAAAQTCASVKDPMP